MMLRMTMLRVGFAGIVLAAMTATANAQPYYPYAQPYYPYPMYDYPYPAYASLPPAYGSAPNPTYRGPAPNYPWVPPVWANPYAFFAPYSSGVGPRADGNTQY
jgi:hypothetical protein